MAKAKYWILKAFETSEHVCDVRKCNKFAREIAKFLTMFYSLIIAHSSCLHMLLPFSLSLYMKIYFLLFLFLTFLLHMALKMFIATFVEFLLPAVDCGICFFFLRFLPYWFESRTNLELCIRLKFLSSFKSDLNRFELLRNFYRPKLKVQRNLSARLIKYKTNVVSTKLTVTLVHKISDFDGNICLEETGNVCY